MLEEKKNGYNEGENKSLIFDGTIHCLHRFIIMEKGDLGIRLECHNLTTARLIVAQDSVGDFLVVEQMTSFVEIERERARGISISAWIK